MTTSVEEPAATSSAVSDRTVYRQAMRWWVIFGLIFLPAAAVFPLFTVFEWQRASATRGSVLVYMILSLIWVDGLVALYYWSVIYPRLTVSQDGIEYRGAGAYMWTTWDNVAGTRSFRSGVREITGLRLIHPRLRRSGPVHFLVSLPYFLALSGMPPPQEPVDDTPEGGVTPTGSWESEPSSVGQPNDFIPLDNFDPGWWSGAGRLGAQIRRYAPQCITGTDAEQAAADMPAPADPPPNWGPPAPSRRTLLQVAGFCTLILAAEIGFVSGMSRAWAGGTFFSDIPDHALLTCSQSDDSCFGIPQVAFSRDGKQILYLAGVGNERVWQVSNGRQVRSTRPNAHAQQFALTSSGVVALGGRKGSPMTVWFPGHPAHILPGTDSQSTATVSPDGHTLVLSGPQNRFSVWRLPEAVRIGTLIAVPQGSEGTQGTVPTALTPGGRLFGILYFIEPLQVWDAVHMRWVRNVGESPDSFAFSSDGSLVATNTDGNKQMQISRVSDGTLVQGMTSENVTTEGFSPDGRLLVAGTNNGRLYVWRVSDGALLHSYRGSHEAAVSSLAVAPDDSRVVAGYEDGSVHVLGL